MEPPTIQAIAAVNSVLSAEEVAGLARQYGTLVYRAACRLVSNHAAAQDIQQDLFLRLLQKPPDGVRSWPAYLTAAAIRLALNQLRGRRQWNRFVHFWQSSEAPHESSPEQEVSADQTGERLRLALARLKPIEAQCFVLRYLHQFEIAQVASSIGISDNYVSVCLHRAIKRLEALGIAA